MKKKKMRLFYLLIFICSFSLLSTGQTVPCNVTQGAGWTRYSVPDFKATDCNYDWSNATNYVVANHDEAMNDLVVNASSVALTTKKCLKKILYSRNCISEGSPREATCTTSCIGPVDADRVVRHYWIAVVVAFTLVAVAVVVLIVVVCSCVD